MSELVKGILRAVSSGLQIPTIIVLILLILLTILMLGSFIAEIVTERRSLKMNIPKLVDELQGKTSAQMKDIIAVSGLLTRQKAAVQELISRVSYPEDTREALARQLIADEESRYNKITKITDLTARVAPMFGLMGTLIPLGPGLIALGEGDAATLSSSMLIAFDTTVAGLVSGAVSYIISGFRKGWYEEYMIGLETIMETVLDVQNKEREDAYHQRQNADAAKAGKNVSKSTITRPSQSGAAKGQAGVAAPMPQSSRMQPQAAPASKPAQAPARPAAPQPMPGTQPQAESSGELQGRAATITAKPTFAQASSKTIAGVDAQQLQEDVRAAEAAMQQSEMEQIQSLDDLLDSFAPTDGRR